MIENIYLQKNIKRQVKINPQKDEDMKNPKYDCCFSVFHRGYYLNIDFYLKLFTLDTEEKKRNVILQNCLVG